MPWCPATKMRRYCRTGSLLALEDAEPMSLRHVVALGRAVVFPHHLRHQLLEARPRPPTQPGPGLGRVAQQRFHLGRPEVPGIDSHDGLAGVHAAREIAPHRGHHADLIGTLALPGERDAELCGRDLDEAPNRVLLAARNDVIVGHRLLEHEPLHLHVVPRMTPVALRLEVADVEAFLQAKTDARQSARDLAGDEGLAA